MMRFAYRRLTVSLLATFVIGAVPISAFADDSTGHVKGGGNEVSATSQAPAGGSNTGYVFVTPEGGSLSVLARRAIQLFDQEENSFSLTPAQAIYIETKLVEELGARYLEIGERVTIPKDRIAALANEARALDAAGIAAWQQYADNVDFNVSSITPESPSGNQQVQSQPEEQKDDGNGRKDDGKNKEDDKDARYNDNLSSWGTLAAIAAIAAAVYFLNPNRKTPVSPAKPAPKAGRKNPKRTRSRKK